MTDILDLTKRNILFAKMYPVLDAFVKFFEGTKTSLRDGKYVYFDANGENRTQLIYDYIDKMPFAIIMGKPYSPRITILDNDGYVFFDKFKGDTNDTIYAPLYQAPVTIPGDLLSKITSANSSQIFKGPANLQDQTSLQILDLHTTRKEIIMAINNRKGFANRTSATTFKNTYYVAKEIIFPGQTIYFRLGYQSQ